MPTFTPPTYNRPIDRKGLFRFYTHPVGLVVLIESDDTVVEKANFTDKQLQAAKAGSGDFGKAVFRNGRTYTVTAGERSLLEGAGYTVDD